VSTSDQPSTTVAETASVHRLQFVAPPPWYKGTNRWMKHSGFKIEVGVGRSPFFLNEMSRRRRLMLPSTMLLKGDPGIGKTYSALRIAEMIDPLFKVTVNMPMDRLSMLNLIGADSPLKRDAVIIVDEAQFTTGSRSWANKDQRALMEIMQSVRSRGYIFIFVALSDRNIDSQLRNDILDFRLDVMGRGKVRVYSLYNDFHGNSRSSKLGELRLLLPGFEGCSDPACLICKSSGLPMNKESTTRWERRSEWRSMGYRPCMNMRAVYERRKRDNLDRRNSELEQQQTTIIEASEGLNENSAVELIRANIETIGRVRGGRLNVDNIAFTLSELLGTTVTPNAAAKLRKKFEFKYPDLMNG